MRFYSQSHRFYAGGDLHARTLYLHVLDADGRTCFDQNLPASPDAFLAAVAPFRDGLVVGVECMFAWYWLADLCAAEGMARRTVAGGCRAHRRPVGRLGTTLHPVLRP